MTDINRTVQLGDREVVRMGLGTNRLSHTPANVGFVNAAVEAGIGLIDTAHLYSGGASEQTIGAAIGRQPHGVVVATKGGFARGHGRPEVLREQIEQSLASLATDVIDLYYLHRVDPDTPLEDSVGVLADYRARGVIRNIGLSQVSVDEVERARLIVPIAAVQSQFNINDRGWNDVVDYCTAAGIVFVPFYPLHVEGPAITAIARAHGVTEPQIALSWLLHRSSQIVPIPGTLSAAHVRQNVAALDIELTEQELAQLS